MATKTTRFTKSNNNPIGMIISSMLTEAQFQALNGTSWVLADGRSVTGSVYATTVGSSTIPDLRGMVLRGKNNSRSDGNEDTAGERALGNFQSHAIESHGHAARASSGAQQLSSSRGLIGGGTDGPGGPYILNGIGGSPFIEATGITETRIKNIAVNHFIKINP